MKNKWTTLIEDQVDKTETLSKALEEADANAPSASRNKVVAIVMATIGIALIGFGIYPFLFNGSSSNLKGDVTGGNPTENNNIFSNDAQPVDNVPAVPKENTASIPPAVPADILDKTPVSPTTETDVLDTKAPASDATIPTPPSSPTIQNSGIDDLLKDPNVTSLLPVDTTGKIDTGTTPAKNPIDLNLGGFQDQTSVPAKAPTASVPDFPQNTHTGLTDKNVMMYGDTKASPKAPTASDTKTSKATPTLHGAAGEMTHAGPEDWWFVGFAVVLALWFRRKKIFCLR